MTSVPQNDYGLLNHVGCHPTLLITHRRDFRSASGNRDEFPRYKDSHAPKGFFFFSASGNRDEYPRYKESVDSSPALPLLSQPGS